MNEEKKEKLRASVVRGNLKSEYRGWFIIDPTNKHYLEKARLLTNIKIGYLMQYLDGTQEWLTSPQIGRIGVQRAQVGKIEGVVISIKKNREYVDVNLLSDKKNALGIGIAHSFPLTYIKDVKFYR